MEECDGVSQHVTIRLNEIFAGYEHGLLLLKAAMGKKSFKIDAAIMANPKSYLENLVLDHYENKDSMTENQSKNASFSADMR